MSVRLIERPGRYANRIKNATFSIDGVDYHTDANENGGLNTLHGGADGWDYRNFTVVAHTTDSITFSIVDPDGKEGFPGEVVSYITYTVAEMAWHIKMTALATTKRTPIMLSSHVRLSAVLKRGIDVSDICLSRHTGISMAFRTTKPP